MEELFKAARTAMANSHSPYSQFPVGAAIRTADGKIHTGTNVENASYPEGICAETAAIAQMVGQGGSKISEILVVAENMDNITPCGGCRQRIAEFGDRQTKIHLCDQNGVIETLALAEMLPKAFGRDW